MVVKTLQRPHFKGFSRFARIPPHKHAILKSRIIDAHEEYRQQAASASPRSRLQEQVARRIQTSESFSQSQRECGQCGGQCSAGGGPRPSGQFVFLRAVRYWIQRCFKRAGPYHKGWRNSASDRLREVCGDTVRFSRRAEFWRDGEPVRVV